MRAQVSRALGRSDLEARFGLELLVVALGRPPANLECRPRREGPIDLGGEPQRRRTVDEAPDEQLRLAGRHRFSRYQLVFGLSDDADGTLLSARTYADFPGLHGRVYRALVIGSGAHVLAVRHMLRSVRSSSAT